MPPMRWWVAASLRWASYWNIPQRQNSRMRSWGNYATGVLIPAFKAAGVQLVSVASRAGVSGVHAGKKYGFEETTTDTARLFNDPKIDALVITTRHDSHADFVMQALEAGKHVFVEKPLCLTLSELDQ